MRIGYFLSSEEYGPEELVNQARWAEQAGFESLWISDHFHPWNDEQGQSPFVWSTIGAISQVCSLPVMTAVSCPTVRVHPAIVAQAAATSAVLTGERFILGVGTGEALNEHVTAARWPDVGVRLEMLEEAVGLIRELWAGHYVDHHGRHYEVENARIYTRPDQPIPVYVSAFGTRAAELAGRIGDGLVATAPDGDVIKAFRAAGGEGKPVSAGYKVCWGRDDDTCIDTAHRLWASAGLPGELAQVLPSPAHVAQASSLVSRAAAESSIAFGDDVGRHVAAFRPYLDAGVDDVHIAQMGAGQDATSAEGFFEFYESRVLPELRGLASGRSGGAS